ncbi:MAG: hypothetical protein AAGA37_19740 [Actinomycetota bacterium]
MTITAKLHLQNAGANADEVRRFIGALTNHASGVMDAGDLAVSERAGTPGMAVDVSAGAALIVGTEASLQGTYFAENSATQTLGVSASDPTNARIDLVVVSVYDAVYSGADDDIVVEIVTGVPASTPQEPAAPANSLVLDRIDVGAGVSQITDAAITRRAAVWERRKTVTFLADGDFVPADYPWARYAKIRATGGGGGGGGAEATGASTASGGGGGGAGGYCETLVTLAELPATVPITIGAGGAGGAAGPNDGTAGGDTVVGSLFTAGGGQAGERGNANSPSNRTGDGGEGGTAIGADLNIPGGGGAGAVLEEATDISTCPGGSGPLSASHRVRLLGSAAYAGEAGVGHGGGGSGALNTSNEAAGAGGAGAAGVVIIELMA